MNGKSRRMAAGTSVTSHKGRSVSRCPPHARHYFRTVVFRKLATLSAPLVIRTDSGTHIVKALTGLADHWRQDVQ
jgi:hypothetical protein